MSLHKEIEFENDICAHLAASGWLYAEGDAAGYDTPRALFPADVLAWVQATLPDAWAALSKTHGAHADAMLLDCLRKQLDDRGTLDVLRVGVEMLGLKAPLKLAQFKPTLAMNNTKDQFSNSPDFTEEQMNAIMDALDAFSTMSKQAINSDKVRQGLKHVLLGPAQLYEALRARGGASSLPA